MKRFTLILTLCGLIFSFFGCKPVKEGPFTFTNKTGEKVYVIISQDKTVAKTLAVDEVYTGEDYFTPKISFVKGIDSEENKKIIDNRFAATTSNGFDYVFNKVPSNSITINLSVSEDFITTYKDYENWYIKEVNSKLGADSNTTVKFSDFKETVQVPDEENSKSPTNETSLDKSYQGTIYTSKPEFRIYRSKTVGEKTEEEDITGYFSVVLNKSEILPADTSTEGATENPTSSTTENTKDTTTQTKPSYQWAVEITYPKIELK